jgi:complement component 1 Q subcomponent-binding protein
MRAVVFPTVSRTCRALLVRAAATGQRRVVASQQATSRRFGAAADGLLDILHREHEEELANASAEMPDELNALYKLVVESRDWKIVEEGATTRLLQTMDARKVQVVFHCQDTVEEEEAYEEEDIEHDEEEETAPVFRFTVTVTKSGNTMVFVCLSKDAQCTIESVNMTKTDVSELDNGVPPVEYQGPEFYELAADLQDAFDQFLSEEIGIDQDVAAFIPMFADYKEQTQYVQFLDEAKHILS